MTKITLPCKYSCFFDIWYQNMVFFQHLIYARYWISMTYMFIYFNVTQKHQIIQNTSQCIIISMSSIKKIYICCMTKNSNIWYNENIKFICIGCISWPGTNIFYGHCKICYTQALKFYVPCNLNNIEKILLVILEMMDSA